MKQCYNCKQWKDESEYLENKYSEDSLNSICNVCLKIRHIINNAKYYDRDIQGRKFCSKCKSWKSELIFNKRMSNKDGLDFWCRDCSQFYDKFVRNKQVKQNQPTCYDRNDKGQKYCKSCKSWKYEKDFSRNCRAKDKLSSECKSCVHKRYVKNSKHIKQISVLYRQNNIDLIRERDRQRNKENRLNRNFGSLIYHALKSNKAGQHWEDLVPYTLQQLKEHLESQFTPPMSWDNYGTYWEIDHIIPQNTFNISSPNDHNFKICWSLMNLRPLEKSLNRQRPKDGSDISEEIKLKILNQFC